MNKNNYVLGFLGLAIAGLLLGCGKDDAGRLPTTDVEAAPAPAGAPESPAPNSKADSANPADLAAGLALVQPHVLSTVDAFSKVEALQTSRYSMHPLLDKDASMEIDVSGFASVTLSPMITDLSPSAECSADPAAGVVAMSYSLDGGAPAKVSVDRNYAEMVVIDTSKSSKLKIDVNAGNGTMTCDWFSVGFLNVAAR